MEKDSRGEGGEGLQEAGGVDSCLRALDWEFGEVAGTGDGVVLERALSVETGDRTSPAAG